MSQEGSQFEQERPPYTYVEIGTGTNSMPNYSNVEFGEDNQYIGVDISKKEIDSAHRVGRLYRDKEPEGVSFVQADGRELPLPAESVDEVILNTLTTSPEVWNEIMARSEDASDGFVFHEMMSEAKRVLRPGGKLVIKDQHDPRPEGQYIPVLEMNGFRILGVLEVGDEHWESEAGKYGMPKELDSFGPKLVVAEYMGSGYQPE